MLRGGAAFLLSFAEGRTGGAAFVARGIGKYLEREATAAALGPVEATFAKLGTSGAAVLDELERERRHRERTRPS